MSITDNMDANKTPLTPARRRKIYAVLLILYLLLLCYLVFFSSTFGRTQLRYTYSYNLIPFREIGRYLTHFRTIPSLFWINIVGNIAAFLPFGYLMPRVFRICQSPLLTTLYGFLLSGAVEIIQLVTRVGSFDVDDLILNTLGTLLGYCLTRLMMRVGKGKER